MRVAARLAVCAILTGLMSASVGAADQEVGPGADARLTPELAAELVADGGRLMSKAEIMASTRLGLWGRTPDEARILSLPDVKALAPGAAAALARYQGTALALDGLDDLSAETAAALAGFASEESPLDLGETVTHIHPWFGYLSLGGLRTISPEAAQALAASEMNLLLDGLTTLSPEAAAGLAAHRGVLSLESLRTIPAATAVALAAHRGGHLVLDGITTLTPEAAAALARYEGSRLSLSGLEELPPETARALAAFQGILRLQGLKSLSLEAARALADSTGAGLSLSGMTTLPAETAAALAEYLGQELLLNGLVEISDEAAASLSECVAKVRLRNLTKASNEAREALAAHMADNEPSMTYAIGVTRLTGDLVPVVGVIAARQGEAVLVNVVNMDGDDAAEVARLLVAVEGQVSLPRLRRISAAALETLHKAPNVALPPTEQLTVVPADAGTGATPVESP